MSTVRNPLALATRRFKFRPLSNKILLIEYEEEPKPGTLILVESEKKNNNLFEVVNTGPDVACLEIGDIVLVEKYCAQMFEIEDAKYFITSEDKILGYIQDEN